MTTGIYKPGINWIKDGDVYLLEQNQNSGSTFAIAAQKGTKIQWVMLEEPIAGRLRYQGDIVINGKRMTKSEGLKLLCTR